MLQKDIIIKALLKCNNDDLRTIANQIASVYDGKIVFKNFKSCSVYGIIFLHSFAKSFWNGEERICISCGEIDYLVGSCTCPTRKMIDWQYHLQQMVLEEEPLTYLEKFLED